MGDFRRKGSRVQAIQWDGTAQTAGSINSLIGEEVVYFSTSSRKTMFTLDNDELGAGRRVLLNQWIVLKLNFLF